MVVCKFFLQGTCKFGSYCHYDHQIPSNYNYTSFNENSQQSTSVLRQSNFANASNAKPSATPSNVDVNTLVKSVVADMMGAEKGGQWLLSCYAPFKEKPAFPEFEDYSPEEIRFGFYEAQKNAALGQYNQQLQVLLQKAVMKVKALQNPSPEVIAILQNIYSSTPSSFSGTYGHNTVSSTGGFSQASSNIFATQNKSSFGQGSGVFASTAQQNSSIFGGSSQNNIFGSSSSGQTQPNIFASTPTQNVFGTNSFSGSQNNTFGNKPPSNIFSCPEQPTNSGNMFGVGTSNLPTFSSPQPSTNIFASAPQSVQPQNIFITQGSDQQSKQISQNIFTSQNQDIPNVNAPQSGFLSQPSNPPSNYSASVFGSSVNTNMNFETTPNKQAVDDETIYSKLEELNAEEKRWFENSELDILNIPNKPPTYDMCFK